MPEFYEQQIVSHNTHVTDADMGYDMIMGIDLLRELRIGILNSTQSIEWDSVEIPMRPSDATMNKHRATPWAVSSFLDDFLAVCCCFLIDVWSILLFNCWSLFYLFSDQFLVDFGRFWSI